MRADLLLSRARYRSARTPCRHARRTSSTLTLRFLFGFYARDAREPKCKVNAHPRVPIGTGDVPIGTLELTGPTATI